MSDGEFVLGAISCVAVAACLVLAGVVSSSMKEAGIRADCERLGKFRIEKDVYECKKVAP